MKNLPFSKKKQVRKKLLKIPKLRDKAFGYFSRYVRLEHAQGVMVQCVTCGKWIDAIHEAHAGHFKHGKDRECYFDERNVNPQCKGCNQYHKTAAMQRYTVFMVEKYGLEVVKTLLDSKKVIWKRAYLERIIETYKAKLKTLEE